MIYCISDNHFFHQNIIKYCDRPFGSVTEMNNYMVARWNDTVLPGDEVIFVGDFAIGWDKENFKTKRDCYRNLLSKLNGTKLLVRGNHDHETIDFYKDVGFADVKDSIILGNILVIHYPLKVDKEYMKPEMVEYIERVIKTCKTGSITKVIHGHIHNNSTVQNEFKHFNVSAEVLDYIPKDLESIIGVLNER